MDADLQEMELDRKVIELISEASGVGSDMIRPESSLTDELGLESLDMVELALAVEDAFEIEISDDELDSFQTTDDVIDHVRTSRLSA